MFGGKPMSDRMKDMRNKIAERALTRGRKWTAAEQLQHLRDALIDDAREVVRHHPQCTGYGKADEHCDCGAVAFLDDLETWST